MGKILEGIVSPEDIKSLSEEQLTGLCDEIRQTIIETVSCNGGHLASNLGVVELTVALLLAFEPGKDSIIWDVGHQSYPYKLLTGRYPKFSTIRKEDGISGFPNRNESPYDLFTTGHSSTSISQALGISESNRILGKDGHVVAVIGDGALTGGLAYEGLNNAGRLHRNLIVVLNDNNMSISKNVGSIAGYLTRLRTKPGYIRTKLNVEALLKKIPKIGVAVAEALRKIKDRIKRAFYKSTLFEDFGLNYYGPFDGHNITQLRRAFESAKLVKGPVLIHVCTSKGKGYRYAEMDPSIYHGLSGFDVPTGNTGERSPSFSDIFGEELCKIAEDEPRVCAITAAMQDGTGLSAFHEKFPDRFFDVGIAEEHAVTFSGGLARGGLIPVFAVYSSFLQRTYDELIHDVALQRTKVVLAVDRAGVVGEDGITHQGLLDVSLLRTVPGATVYSPAGYEELRLDLRYLIEKCDRICAVRYPRGKEIYLPPDFTPSTEPYTLYGDPKAPVCIVTYGRLFSFASQARIELAERGIEASVLKLNRIIPLDENAVRSVLDCESLFFFEEGTESGGVGEQFLLCLEESGFKGDVSLRAVKDPFLAHAPMFRTLEKLGLNTEGMVGLILSSLPVSEETRAKKA